MSADFARARRELAEFLGVDGDAVDDVSYEPRRGRRSGPSARSVYDGTCPPRPDWFDDAACRSEATAWFFSVGNTGRAAGLSAEQEAALAICARCPVMDPCREYGREHRLHGIWGGETELDRAEVDRAPIVGATAAANRAATRVRREGRP